LHLRGREAGGVPNKLAATVLPFPYSLKGGTNAPGYDKS
jgi:hypothetical protein